MRRQDYREVVPGEPCAGPATPLSLGSPPRSILAGSVRTPPDTCDETSVNSGTGHHGGPRALSADRRGTAGHLHGTRKCALEGACDKGRDCIHAEVFGLEKHLIVNVRVT